MPVELTASTDHLRTSDTVVVTLCVTGTAPLRVEMPKDLLAPQSAAVWEVVSADAGGYSADTGTWVQRFTLSPYIPSDDLTLTFNPIKVNGTEVAPGSLRFKVDSLRDVTDADALPVTSIEELPPLPQAGSPLIAVGITLTVTLSLLLAVVLAVAYRRKPKAVPPGEWVRGRLAELQTELLAGRRSQTEFVNALSLAVREYLRRRFGLDAEKLTTAELLAGQWGDAEAGLAGVLRACDGVKFAGQVPTRDECDALLEQVGQLIGQWDEPGRG